MLNTPVLFLVFNRLETTKQVFAQIRKAQPRQLFIGADGARVGKEGEAEKVQAVRQYILDNIDWDCEVQTLFREQNLGCGKAVSEAITWFFDNVEQGIILEDDILPEDSFFLFCEELLERYKHEERIMHITGFNFQQQNWGNPSYYFSAYATSIWGWATWRRAWQQYDAQMLGWQSFLDTPEAKEILIFDSVIQHYTYEFGLVMSKKHDTWDYQWLYSFWKNKGLSIIPNANFIQNIGFGEDATHTTNTQNNFMQNITYHNIVFPLQHPTTVERNKEADKNRLYSKYLSAKRINYFNKIISTIKKILKFA